MVVLRTFEDVSVNMFDTFEETVKFYGDEYCHQSLNGTSICVQIQNHMRARSTAKKDDGSWKYTEKELILDADTFKPSISAAAQRTQEEYDNASPALRILMDEQAENKKRDNDLKKRMVALKGQQKPQTSGTVVKDRKSQ